MELLLCFWGPYPSEVWETLTYSMCTLSAEHKHCVDYVLGYSIMVTRGEELSVINDRIKKNWFVPLVVCTFKGIKDLATVRSC